MSMIYSMENLEWSKLMTRISLLMMMIDGKPHSHISSNTMMPCCIL